MVSVVLHQIVHAKVPTPQLLDPSVAKSSQLPYSLELALSHRKLTHPEPVMSWNNEQRLSTLSSVQNTFEGPSPSRAPCEICSDSCTHITCLLPSAQSCLFPFLRGVTCSTLPQSPFTANPIEDRSIYYLLYNHDWITPLAILFTVIS